MNITDIFGPPPPGINLDDNRSSRDNSVVVTICILAVLTVVARFLVRKYVQGARLAADDWLIGASTILLIALLTMSVFGINITIESGSFYGFGKHVWCTTLEAMLIMRKTLFAYLLIYLVELLLIKLSILMFYRRIFGMNWMIWTTLFISCGWAIGSFVAALCASHPISYFWTETVDPASGRYRYNFYYYYLGNATANVVTDVLILLVPIHTVWKLQMRTSQKIGVCGVLLLGGFVCIASGIRIHYITFLKDNVDITWALSDVSVWSTVEPCIGIICACLPVLQPFIRAAVKRLPKLPGSPVQMRRFTSHVRERTSFHTRYSSKHEMWHGEAQGTRTSPTPFFHSDQDSQTQLKMVRTRVEIENDPAEKNDLEDGMDPMAIRVKRVVHWTVD
ncbi:uncharacterized protein N7515_005296 [Penicillium bovifimosum]|uniref:Rhodopsin domain-containing protein n=1 Tax=Penicillium bovifimosum TaxID=126998 RepID=A0A9W9L023_9EURO|nr:uncharacterized protein N7515_005296 [Penicillium bovifimosum]KAJ5129257.1 hypothetical protein N7515_005296 [Penicillium bovifimosum]